MLRFAKVMEHKLSLNRHKGDAAAWRKDHEEDLHFRLTQEVDELYEAISDKKAAEIVLEAADAANFAMMIGDKMIENSNT